MFNFKKEKFLCFFQSFIFANNKNDYLKGKTQKNIHRKKIKNFEIHRNMTI